MQSSSKKQPLLLNTNIEKLSELEKWLVSVTQFTILTASSARAAINILKVESIGFIISNIKLFNQIFE